MEKFSCDVDFFVDKLNNLLISLTNEQIQQFLSYFEMLINRNRVMNLTSITDYYEVIDKHFIDSLSLNRVLTLDHSMSVIDLGTGAGFPGIPLKIAFPDLEITLVDSLQKRVNFLTDVIDELSLSGIYAVHGRAEELARREDYREQYDVCVSRAVANLSTLSEYCLPFVKIDGKFISYKSAGIDEELDRAKQAISLLGGAVGKVDKFHIEEGARSLVVIDKRKNTPKKYPRKAGTPTRNPL